MKKLQILKAARIAHIAIWTIIALLIIDLRLRLHSHPSHRLSFIYPSRLVNADMCCFPTCHSVKCLDYCINY